jgi:lysophospholipase L1-like esterase
MIRVLSNDPRLQWEGAVSLQMGDGWVQPWRLPFDEAPLWHDELRQRASTPAGVRIAFRTDATTIGGCINRDETDWRLDLVIDGQFYASTELACVETFQFTELPTGMKVVELWLPQRRVVQVIHIDVNDNAQIEPYDDTRLRWVTHGSSITHCADAESPTGTWPGVAARLADIHHTNLGYGGHDHLDVVVARTIRGLPADFITIKAGINAYGSGSLGLRTFRSSLLAFVRIIREKHEVTPLLIVSPTYIPRYDTVPLEPNIQGMTLPQWREEVAECVETLSSYGDAHVRYMSGLSLIGEGDAHLLHDNVHPNAEGYQLMGHRFHELVLSDFMSDVKGR